jgi:hypothetical protein
MSKKADVIQRAYLLRHLARVRRRYGAGSEALKAIDELREWVKAQRTRARKPGGLGR